MSSDSLAASLPFQILHRKEPRTLRTLKESMRAAYVSATIPSWSRDFTPLAFGAKSLSTTSADLPLRHCKTFVVDSGFSMSVLGRKVAPGTGSIGRRSRPMTVPLVVVWSAPLALILSTITCVQAPGAAPHSTTVQPGFRIRYLSSISTSL